MKTLNKDTNEIRTAEFARIGHPDRVCDIIADALLDEFIKQDPNSRVALEVFGAHGIITLSGEITTEGYVDITKIVKEVYREIGYTDEIGVQTNIVRQSSEIQKHADQGAGDSGIVTGYATNETPEMLPKEVVKAKEVVDFLEDNRVLFGLYPDGKVQVSMRGNEIEDLVVSVQGIEKIERPLRQNLNNMFPSKNLHLTVFDKGGFEADTGLTGRKNVLWYGPRIPTGGGAFAGKDATKVDRSGAYYARQLAIQEVNIGVKECLVEIVYVIGQDKPVCIKRNGEEILSGCNVNEIIKQLDLKKPIYKEASAKGHFGYKDCPWEL